MKELQERQTEIDEQIRDKLEILEALKKALELTKNSPGFDDDVRRIFERNIEGFIAKLEDLRNTWNMIDGCCTELEQKNK